MIESPERRRERARARVAMEGQIVRSGAPKPGLYSGLSLLERLACMTELCRRQWLASGREIDLRPRESWPGEVIEFRRG